MTDTRTQLDANVAALERMAEGHSGQVVERGGLAEAAQFMRRYGTQQMGAGRRGRDWPGKPYRQVAVVRAAVSRKANCLAMLPPKLSTRDDKIIESGPAYDWTCRPCPGMSWRDFRISVSAWIDLTGVCHLIMPRSTWRGNAPTITIPVGALQMKPVTSRPNDKGELVAWMYRPRGHGWSEAIRIELDEVWSIAEESFDPDEPFGFSSRLESAGFATAQIFKADLANEASLDNGVEPGGVFTMDGTPTEKQLADTRDQIGERHTGVRNRRRHMLLYGGIKWQTIAASFAEMEFSVLQKMKIVDVCVALDVDPAAIGYYQDSNYAHSESAKASLWLDTVLPRDAWINDEMQRGVVRRMATDASYAASDARRSARTSHRSEKLCAARRRAMAVHPADNIVLWSDSSSISAVRAAMLARSKEGAIWIDSYKATPADVIEALDLPLEIHPWQELGWQAIGQMPIDPILAPDNASAGQPGNDDPAATENENEDAAETYDEPQGKAAVVRGLSEADIVAIYDAWRRSWAGLERAVRGKVERHRFELRRQMLANLATATSAAERSMARAIEPDIVGRILFNLAEANGKLWASVGPLMRESVRLGGQQSLDEAAVAEGRPAEKADPFSVELPGVNEELMKRKFRFARTNVTLQNKLRQTLDASVRQSIAAGMDDGQTITQLGDTIREQFGFAGRQAQTIARTETGAAVEKARQIGRRQANVPMKSWLWSRKETGRDWHRACEKQTMANPIATDADFVLPQTGNTCQCPRDTGDPRDDINCGCTTVSRYADDQKDARVLIHLKTAGPLTYERLTARDAADSARMENKP